jgi:hypothetical protein
LAERRGQVLESADVVAVGRRHDPGQPVDMAREQVGLLDQSALQPAVARAMSFQLADVVVPHTWLTAETGNNVAPAYYVVAAAIVSLLTILTIRETAGRSLPQGVADEMFQSNADVRGAATPG